MTGTQGRAAAIVGVAGFAALWGASVWYLFAAGNEDWFTGVLVMGIFGLALSAVAWILTRGAAAPPIEVKRPALESGAILIYLVLYAVGFLGYGMSAVRAAFPEGPEQEILVMGLKLLAHVVLPALILVALGARLLPLVQTGLRGRKFWRTLIVISAIFVGLSCVMTPSLKEIAETKAPISVLAWTAPVSFVWIAIEAGLNEEFLFRAVLQTRLSALFRSPWAGVMVTSLIFGVAHAPGLFLRGGPGVDGWSTDPLQVVAYTIAVLAPLGLLAGLIYARTKSLLLVILVHASLDWLPNLADFIRVWT
jgi:membrane protease YdiL (CAAX protease family)